MNSQTIVSLVNGQEADQISVFDRAFQFGDSVFETLRYSSGCCPLKKLHFDRLLNGCSVLGIALEPELLEQRFNELLSHIEPLAIDAATLKIVVTRGCSSRGYQANNENSANIVALAFKVRNSNITLPIRLTVSPITLAEQPVLAGIKHNNRLEQVLAKQALLEYDDALLCNAKGDVIEAISSNVFIYKQGCWKTPELQTCGVHGVTRRLLIESIIPNSSGQLSIERLSLLDVLQAEEVFICNSISGIVPVASFEFEGEKLSSQTLGLAPKKANKVWHEFPETKQLAVHFNALFERG